MGKTVVLEGPALEWARGCFRTYYGTAVLEAPKALARREFALFPFTTESMMRRHTAFPTLDAFRGYLRREAPRHAYYSSAYYERPDHPKMADKEWLGADLIFDLDADHLRDAAGRDYAGQLDLVKAKVRDLIDDFLRRDFGIDPGELQLVFSGGRGYHVHVQSEAFAQLGSPERREIVDYILGNGVDPVRFLTERRLAGSGGAVELTADDGAGESPGRAKRQLRPFLRIPPPETPGWGGRISRSFQRTLTRWELGGAPLAIQELQEAGADPVSAKSLASLLVTKGRGRLMLQTGSLEAFPGRVPGALLDVVLRHATVEVQGETDAPVTTDIHRLIRLPGSLHGGTGFQVIVLRREQLDAFDPFTMALPFVGAGETEVELLEAVDHPFAVRVHGAPGERRVLPNAVALFLVLRGEARLPPAPAP
jgi:DNA primase small subunit